MFKFIINRKLDIKKLTDLSKQIKITAADVKTHIKQNFITARIAQLLLLVSIQIAVRFQQQQRTLSLHLLTLPTKQFSCSNLEPRQTVVFLCAIFFLRLEIPVPAFKI